MTISQLVEQFVVLALDQFKAELLGKIAKYNRCYRAITAIGDELKRRPGDQRTALLSLLTHQNAQVRLMAAELTLGVARSEACATLQEIWDNKEFPQAAFAMGTLMALERGTRKPI